MAPLLFRPRFGGFSFAANTLKLRNASTLPTRRFDLKNNYFESGVQKVYGGTECLDGFIETVKQAGKKPLLVTDQGIVKVGVAEKVVEELKRHGLNPTVYDSCQPNPSYKDTIGIANMFLESNCDSVIGVGGGGPLDAAKGGMALIAKKRVDGAFNLNTKGADLMNNIRTFLSKEATEAYFAAVPRMGAIPTTAGTGSEGGKSAVITNTSGVKVVFGNPAFFPRTVALVPQFTKDLPPRLTACTGVDALFHCMEAYFVTHAAAIKDGCTEEEIVACDEFALAGIYLVIANLENAYLRGTVDLDARLSMLFAAYFGAKAFRKGDLGGVHATAHALGSLYHLHHGESIARMSVPMLHFNRKHIDQETIIKFKLVNSLFQMASGEEDASLARTVRLFLAKFALPIGLEGLKRVPDDIEKLTQLAANDPCQTNPVPMDADKYRVVFQVAEAGV